MTEQINDGEVNCLELAASQARDGRDELIFLRDNRSAVEGNADGAGHVLVRDKATGRVRDPMLGESGPSYAGVDAWVAAQGSGRSTPAYSQEGFAAAEDVRAVLSLPPAERADRVDELGGPWLRHLGERRYADAARPDFDVGRFVATVVRGLAGSPDDYEPAGRETKAPDFKDYVGPIQAPDEARGEIRYEDKDGKKIASREENPVLYADVKDDFETQQGLIGSKDEGYRRATDNEVWPKATGIAVSAPDELGPDVIRYRRGDERVVVRRDDNPGLYGYLTRLGELIADTPAKEAVERAWGDGHALAGEKDAAPVFGDYAEIGEAKDGVVTYETKDGSRVVVAERMSPELFKEVRSAGDTRRALDEQEKDGWKVAGADLNVPDKEITTFGWPEELGNGLIRFQTRNDGGYVVSDKVNKPLYDQIVEKNAGHRQEEVDKLREEFGLGPQDELDILSAKTDQKSDPKDDKSELLTVAGAATANLIDDYRKAIDEGKLAKDGPEAKLVKALEAQSALTNGRNITGYEETIQAGGTWRESDDKTTLLNGADHQDIIDGKKVRETIGDLLGSNEKIAGDYKTKLEEAMGKVEGREQMADDLEAMLKSDEYVEYLGKLDEKGMKDAASADVNRMVKSLSLLDPERGKAVSQDLMKRTLVDELDELVTDPSKISDENKALALKDQFGLLKSLLKYEVFDVPRRVEDTIDKFYNEYLNDRRKASEVADAWARLQDTVNRGGTLSEADINRVANGSYIPVADRGAVGEMLHTLNSKGILGSMGGGVSLAGGIYQLAGKGGQLADTPTERLAIAKDFVSFAGASQHFINTGMFDKLAGSNLRELWQLDKSVPEIWGSDGLWGKKLAEARPEGVTPLNDLPARPAGDPPRLGDVPQGAADEFRGQLDAATDRIFARYSADPTPDGVRLPGGTQPVDDSIYEGIAQMFEREAKVPPTTGQKIAGSTVKVLGAAADTFSGVADIVLGAFTIKSGIHNGSDLEKAAGATQVAGGALAGTAGAVGIASLFGSVGAASAFTGPLALAGAVLVGVGGIIGYFVDHEKKQKATDKEGQWYKDVAAFGMAQPDWGDKVEYARYAFSRYGQRDAPADQSIYEFQAKEWGEFRSTPQKGGSSSNRLDEFVHIDWEGDGKNEVTKTQEEPEALSGS